MGSTAKYRGSCNVRKLGMIVYDNPKFLVVLRDLLSTGYEWRLTSDVRERAGLAVNTPADNGLWHSFTATGIVNGYFETKKIDTPTKKYFIRPADGSLDKIQKVIEWVEK